MPRSIRQIGGAQQVENATSQIGSLSWVRLECKHLGGAAVEARPRATGFVAKSKL